MTIKPPKGQKLDSVLPTTAIILWTQPVTTTVLNKNNMLLIIRVYTYVI